jgi:glycosyltransferase involved in cell wall biosynthesis
MKILHLITRMDRGGSAVNTLLSATEQVRAGHTVVLAFGPSEESEMSAAEAARVDEELARFETAGGRIVILDQLLRSIGGHDIRAWRQMRRLMRAERFDLLHTHTSKAGALGRLAAPRKLAVVHTPHGHVFHGYFGAAKTRLFIAIERWLARRTHALIALTRAERDDHLQLHIGSPAQWHVVPSGVDVDSIAAQISGLRRDTKRWQAVSVGRLVPVKGMDRLIRAWAVVAHDRPDARLAIVGDGPERVALEALRDELGLHGQVHFAGWDDPLPYLAEARSFALLSHNEGMGRAVVEAMAASLPCVVADICGLQELVDDSIGRVVDADDSEAVAAALLHAWPDTVTAVARKRADSYSVRAMIDGLEAIYREVRHAA